MEGILDFDKQLDIEQLDRICEIFFYGRGEEQANAQRVLTAFQEHADAWRRADYILENAKTTNAKFIALQILERLVQTRWNSLGREQCEGIRGYIVSAIIKGSTDEGFFRKERVFINKLNVVLVQILKHEWPRRWPGFIDELTLASRESITLCENSMGILKLLSEEVFNYSSEQMTMLRIKTMKEQLAKDFSTIFQLFLEVLSNGQRFSLVSGTLDALLLYLRWIPLGYIFETELIDIVISRLLNTAQYQNRAVKCLTEIAGVYIPAQHGVKAAGVVGKVVECIYGRYGDIAAGKLETHYSVGTDDEQALVQNFAIFLTSWFEQHLLFLEGTVGRDAVLGGHAYLLQCTLIEDREVFKVCLGYWTHFAGVLYASADGGRRDTYRDVISGLRLAMINRMAKPEEVLVVEGDNGEVIREQTTETETLQIYQDMRAVLVYLTHIDAECMCSVMRDMLQELFEDENWSWTAINRVCWAVGSTSGALSREQEDGFLVAIIRDLLSLCELKAGKDNKAIIASGIMYVIGQHPRFLRSHWRFMKTVVRKLFEFMHERHEGVQDMACDTFMLVAKKCTTHFLVVQASESAPFVDEILDELPTITCDLQPHQKNSFIETTALIIAETPDKTAQAAQITRLMAPTNAMWEHLIGILSGNISALSNRETAKQLAALLRTNTAACRALGQAFFVQLSIVFMDMLSLYSSASSLVDAEVERQGQLAPKMVAVRNLRAIKKEILALLKTFLSQALELQAISNGILPPLFSTILADYKASHECVREPEVLSVAETTIVQLNMTISPHIPAILDSILDPTLPMISRDFSEYPEHRLLFFSLLKAINAHCFDALISLPAARFKLIVDCIVWAFKHTARDISSLGLEACHHMLRCVSLNTPVAIQFYRQHYTTFLHEILFVLTDPDHKAAFPLHAAILAVLIEAADVQDIPEAAISRAAVSEELTRLLSAAFQHLPQEQCALFVKGLFDLYKTKQIFKEHLRDFLISLKEFSEATQELFAEEAELERTRKELSEKEAKMAVPGMIKPSDLPDDLE
uniref:Exportin-1 n=1 Tax=Metchnikovella dogieli TaxID=2804710 RepID=A0A896WRV9_9MICR|nr:exportin 1 [Metchnikovella dogieli]